MATIKNVLVAIDFSESSLAALNHAESLVKRHGGELHAVHVQPTALVVNGVGGWPVEFELTPQQKQDLTQKLDALVQKVDVPVVSKILWNSSVARAINDYAGVHHIDLLVLGTHARRGLERFFLGSVAAELVRSASISCLVVGEQQMPNAEGFRHVVVGVDFSADSVAALRAAVALADKGKTRITALHAFDPTALSPYYLYNSADEDRVWAQQKLAKTIVELNFDIEIEKVVVMGRPYEEIVEHVREFDADLLVVGSHGRGMLERMLMGSVAERTLRTAPCAVLVHRDTSLSTED